MERHNHVELARVLLGRGDLAGAEIAARRALAGFAADGVPYIVRAEVMEAQGRMEEAIEAARRATVFRPTDVLADTLLDRLLLAGDDDLSEAETCFLRALKADPGLFDAKYPLAQVRSREHDNAESLRLAREPMEESTSNPHAYRLLGYIQAAREELEQAEAAFRATIELDPTVTGFHESLLSVCARRQTARGMEASVAR